MYSAALKLFQNFLSFDVRGVNRHCCVLFRHSGLLFLLSTYIKHAHHQSPDERRFWLRMPAGLQKLVFHVAPYEIENDS